MNSNSQKKPALGRGLSSLLQNTNTDVTSVNESPVGSISEIALSSIETNPFNPRTTIQYDLPISGNVRVIIYNVAGQEVKRLVNSAQEAGYHSVVWNGTNVSGAKAAAGIYFYQIQTGGFVRTKKMLLLK